MDFKNLVKWFKSEQRDLPWRRDRTPYAVWVSEMMLQQTQVAVVCPYFERWMVRFPTISHLAEANLDEVIKIWEGLGYYSRARYLHSGARYIVENHGGRFPDRFEDLQKIKGLGVYTCGAILSFAFRKRISAVDGNVLRVMARYFAIERDISKPQTVKEIRDRVEELLPEEESWVANEALIELGATICTKQPSCQKCPVKSSCKSYQQAVVDQFPVKSKKTKTEKIYRTVLVIFRDNEVLLRRGQAGEIMSDLYEFPYFETGEEGILVAELQKQARSQFSLRLENPEALEKVSHSFTRYRAHLTPIRFDCAEEIIPVKGPYQWIQVQELHKYPFSSGHRRILQQIISQ